MRTHHRFPRAFRTIALAMAIAAPGVLRADPIPSSHPQPGSDRSWLARHQYLAALVTKASRRPPMDIYFLGDSITEYWPETAPGVWRAEFGKFHVVNCGMAGDTTRNILYRLANGAFDRIEPRVAVVLAGTNNLSRDPHAEPADVAAGVARIVATLRAKSPKTRILLVSILPSGPRADPLRARIRATNSHLAKLADAPSVTYFDLHDSFLDPQGDFLPGVTLDGTHLSAKGYGIWADAMRPVLAGLLKN